MSSVPAQTSASLSWCRDSLPLYFDNRSKYCFQLFTTKYNIALTKTTTKTAATQLKPVAVTGCSCGQRDQKNAHTEKTTAAVLIGMPDSPGERQQEVACPAAEFTSRAGSRWKGCSTVDSLLRRAR